MAETKSEPGFFRRHYIFTTILIGTTVVVALGLLGSKSTVSSNSASSSDLSTTVHTTSEGIQITNNETSDWTDCYVGVNGSTGWGFDNPPYRTHGAFWLGSDVIPAGKTITANYSLLSNENGDRFNIDTQAVNTILVDCFNNTRSWVGTAK